MSQGYDRWVGYVDVVAGANVFVFRENVTNYNRTIAPGRYWLYDAATDIPGYPSFYRVLRQSMDAAAAGGNTYAVEAANPIGGPQDTYQGIRYLRTAGSLTWGFVFSSASFTLPKWLFGFPANQSADSIGHTTSLTAPRGLRRVWVSPVWHTQAIAYPIRRVASSTEDVWLPSAYQVAWLDATVRIYQYRYVPATYVHAERAFDPCYTTPLALLPGDDAIAFDHLWRDCLSRLGTVLVLRERGNDPLALRLANLPARLLEPCRLYNLAQRQALENIAQLQISNGERYNLSLAMVRV